MFIGYTRARFYSSRSPPIYKPRRRDPDRKKRRGRLFASPVGGPDSNRFAEAL